jgi:crotonobetainyl-CoA:carnitine CoA-transferase CaiB-like acyl-CoA transferase
MQPLQNITVVSVEQAVAAPFATRHLADLGARVIKIERPGTGDFTWGYDQSVKGLSSHFVWLNRTKESLTLNLKRPLGQLILEQLLSQADVFIHNLAPGAMDRLGFDQERLRTTYPGLIICHISGYGSDGPYRDKKAYDLLIQAEAGLLSITGTADTPSKAGISVADIAAGMYAFSGILTALLAWQATGEGRVVEVSLLEALAEWMGYPAYYTMGGAPPRRSGARHAAIAPYGPFNTGDGYTILLGIQNEREWERFCRQVLEETGLVQDPRFAGNTLRVENHPALREAGRHPSEVKRTMMTLVFCGRNEAELKQRASFFYRNWIPELTDQPFDSLLEWLDNMLGPLLKSIGATFCPIVGTPDGVVQQIDAYAKAGVEELILQWWDVDDIEGLQMCAGLSCRVWKDQLKIHTNFRPVSLVHI